MKLLVERQRHIICVTVGMFNCCFIRVNDYILVCVMVFVWESNVRNVVVGYKRILCRGFRFVSP